jgi:DNA (cytosine-5)-methyltransferase 1
MPAATATRDRAEVIRVARPAPDAPPRSGSLFTGTAGLDMAAHEIFDAELSWVAEHEPPDKKGRTTQAAARLLAHRLPEVPNLGDITRVDWDLVAQLAPVSILTAGWPCQPFSLAGKRKGVDDERAIWPEVDRCLRSLRPRWILLENVPAVAGCGELERVATTLASVGYRFAWVCLPASAVGAPHRRVRFFLLAVAEDTDGATGDQRRSAAPRQEKGRRTRADSCRRGRVPASETGHADWAGYEPAIRRWERILGRQAPVPTVVGARGGRTLNPALAEWMMGLPDGWITEVPNLSRAAMMKLVGNGVVPRQATVAYRYLLGVLDEDARNRSHVQVAPVG